MSKSASPASFRDKSGFVFSSEGVLYRQISLSYRETYDHLLSSGLYDLLVKENLLISHREADDKGLFGPDAYKIIKPDFIHFISYPYEWCFSQLKAAALATLEIQKKAIQHGLILKDSSAYNIQFKAGKPILIDTLSFEKYHEGRPWNAYRQFCQHFLAPLALMSFKDVRLNQLLRVYLDGIPLDLASRLLPYRACLNLPIFFHIIAHAKFQKRYESTNNPKVSAKNAISQFKLLAIIDDLSGAVRSLRWDPAGTEWADYYKTIHYAEESFGQKKEIVSGYLKKTGVKKLWDVGANTGVFSRIAASQGMDVISIDIDPAAVEKNYLESIQKKESNILPLLIDISNPSPGIGWQNCERMALADRGPAEAVLALALLHHLVISANVPVLKIAEFFNKICSYLIIEFVPVSDPQAQKILSDSDGNIHGYTQESFEKDFSRLFDIEDKKPVEGTERTIYLMKRLPV